MSDVLDDIIGRAANPGPALIGPVAQLLREALREQFETQAARFGDPWEPILGATARRRRYADYGLDTALVETGELKSSLTVEGAAHGYAELRAPFTLALGTDAPGAVEAQFGTANEVTRPIVPDELADDLAEAIADKLGDCILNGLLK
ncbi:MAG TPA: phage virion morphogenesis protein [Gemmatimonadales bacterium]|nr:phage virion morphogenesis protein [Gemmatimonadales bacterium]